MSQQRLLYTILYICLCLPLSAQVKTIKKDSVKVYQNIESFSKKRKFTKFVHRLIFKPTEKIAQKKKELNTADDFEPYEGKIIRGITIQTLDPFGFELIGPDKHPIKKIEKAGNSLHLKTKIWTVKNQLLFKKNDRLDTVLIKESKRLIQQQRYIRKVSIQPKPINNSIDSIDIVITVLDSWSLIPTGTLSESRGSFEITERNFFGLGHEFENNFKQQFIDNKNAYGMRYSIPNFRNTFIRSTFLYENDFNNNYIKGIALNRPFFSPLTKWAAGIVLEQRFYKDSIKAINQATIFENFKLESQDYWTGYSHPLFKKQKKGEEITNLITAIRYKNTKYLESPLIKYDSINFFSNSKLYLASIGITTRKYVVDKYLFNYGIPEYVQIGKTYSITGGVEKKNNLNRMYLGGRYSIGGYYSFGYLAGNIELGSFFNQNITQQSTLNVDINYFTPLLHLGNWKFRQFIKPQLTLGTNRLQTESDLITISGNSGIQGFEISQKGTKKLLITLQTQSYVPGNLYGFRLSPFYNMGFGMLGFNDNNLLQNKLYSKFGIGIILSNDYLVFNNFIVSFAYYPTIPGIGDNIFKSNAYNNNTIGLTEFQIGSPTIVPYE